MNKLNGLGARVATKKKRILVGGTVIVAGLLIAGLFVSGMFSSGRSTLRQDIKYPAVSQSDIDYLNSQVDKSLTYDVVAANPDAYKNKVVQWPAKVFTAPENDGNSVSLQVYATDGDKPYLVYYDDPSFSVNEDDYLIVTGVVAGSFAGQNAFGAGLDRVGVLASHIQKSSRIEAFAPALETKQINKTDVQNGFKVTADKIERAANETRLYLTIKNDSGSDVSFYPSSTAIVQRGQQYKEQYTTEAEDMPSDYKPGVTSSGIVIFPKLTDLKDIRIYMDEAYSSDSYELQWNKITIDT